MNESIDVDLIVAKLKKGEKFGMFDSGRRCFFEDGTRANYQTLWRAIRIVNNIEESKPCRNLASEVPDNYVGTFSYKYPGHKWNADEDESIFSIFSRLFSWGKVNRKQGAKEGITS